MKVSEVKLLFLIIFDKIDSFVSEISQKPLKYQLELIRFYFSLVQAGIFDHSYSLLVLSILHKEGQDLRQDLLLGSTAHLIVNVQQRSHERSSRSRVAAYEDHRRVCDSFDVVQSFEMMSLGQREIRREVRVDE
jgi:hypothetical protein